MRTGHKFVGNSMVVYLVQNENEDNPKFGFVVSKSVGSAVERNLVKRRLRSAIRDRLATFSPGKTLVVRALPIARSSTWLEFCEDLDHCLSRVNK
jgi:ribonuclease P protein component